MNIEPEWLYFILGLIAWQILKMLAQSINQAIIEYRQKKFIKLVKIEFPDQAKITFMTVDSSDKRAMAKLERRLREEHNLSEPET